MRKPLLTDANTEAADQPAHHVSLISTFVFHYLDIEVFLVLQYVRNILTGWLMELS